MWEVILINAYKTVQNQILNMLKKMAFSNNNDILSALYIRNDKQEDHIKEIDLSNISKIRMDTNGSIEMVFVDRLKVLLKLQEFIKHLSNLENENNFFNVIEQNAANYSKEVDNYEKQN